MFGCWYVLVFGFFFGGVGFCVIGDIMGFVSNFLCGVCSGVVGMCSGVGGGIFGFVCGVCGGVCGFV